MHNLPERLQTVIKQLKASSQISNEFLVDLLSESKIEKSDLVGYERYNHNLKDSYGRTALYDGGFFNIYVMSWNTNDFTAIHSHGHSDWGAVLFFGNAAHRLYEVNNKNIKLLNNDNIEAGEVKEVCGDLIHAMGNKSSDPFQTLHIYGSNSYKGTITEDSRVYDIERNKIHTTFGPAFLHINNENCKKSETGIITDAQTLLDYLNIIEPFYNKNNMLEMLAKIEQLRANPEIYLMQE